MQQTRRTRQVLATAARVALTGTLCVLLAEQPLLAEAAVRKAATPSASSIPLQGEQRVVHALNRLTFGPRPGEVAAVEKMGLDRWFEQQLKPQTIDDSAFEARLAAYPALQLSLPAMEARYPSPQLLKQMEDGRVPLPSDPEARVLAEDQLAFYSMRKEAAAEKKANAALAGMTATGEAAKAEPPSPSPSTVVAAQQSRRRQQQVNAGLDAMLASDSPKGSPIAAPAAAAKSADGPSAVAAGPSPLAAGPPTVASQPDLQELFSQPPAARFNTILHRSPDELVRLRGALTGGQAERLTEGMTPLQRETLTALPGSGRMIGLEVAESRLDRDLYSSRQLEAVMTDFWLNHFNVFVGKNQNEPYLLPAYERETIRPHALGHFEDLLVATAKSPAMLMYLDNFSSIGPDSVATGRVDRLKTMRPDGKVAKKLSAGLNENYGRELMELHTLGVDGGYTQADVTSVARVFTGWTIDKPFAAKRGGEGGYVFDERRHEPGSKLVLGHTIKEGGEREGLEVLHLLATSPATARFLSTKLAVRFVFDDPPPALVDRMAATYLATQGDISAVLRTMFHAPEFWAPQVFHAKVKTPLEFVVSAARASDLQISSPQALVQSINMLGMPLYGKQTPNGYSWKQEDWLNTGALVSRLNFGLVMSDDRLPGTRTEWTALLDAPPAKASVVPAAYTPAAPDAELTAKEGRLELLLLGQPASDRTRAAVLAQAGNTTVAEQAATQFDLRGTGRKGNYAGRGLGNLAHSSGPDDAQAAVMAGLLLGSPEFQRR